MFMIIVILCTPGMLKEFPPKSVCLKQPFAIQPWANSEENIGNLLMVFDYLDSLYCSYVIFVFHA